MAAYTLYDILIELIGTCRAPEDQRKLMIESVREAERMAALGNVAANIECPHAELDRAGYCTECGRRIESRDGGRWNDHRPPNSTFFGTHIPR